MAQSEKTRAPGPGEVHLWYTVLPPLRGSPLLDQYATCLSADEARRYERFRHESGRQQALVSRVLVRSVLSEYTGEPLTVWRFHQGPHGKPYVSSPASENLQFNLSHTRDLVVCAVTQGAAVGVDVEGVSRRTNADKLARRYFAPSEYETLNDLEEPALSERFFQFWTLKEAYLKARGSGLSLPLDGFGFTISAKAPPSVRFDPKKIRDDENAWQFALLRLGDHRIAVAVEGAFGQGPHVCLIQTVPLSQKAKPVGLSPTQAKQWFVPHERAFPLPPASAHPPAATEPFRRHDLGSAEFVEDE